MKIFFKPFLILFFIVYYSIPTSIACLWDYDTIEMERVQFPSVLELLAGTFVRHSSEFYYWRVKDRQHKLKQYPDSLALYDDLAVAYSKIGEHEKAIELMQQKEKLQPNLYETYSNLGTFYIFSGDLKEALNYIEKALKINQNAHFGREIYQKHLVEYLLSKMKNGKIQFPLDTHFYNYPQDHFNKVSEHNFYGFLLEKHNQKAKKSEKYLPDNELEKSIIGVMGMMHFADHNSPILLELLGDLLFGRGDRLGARHLASRAYLKASYQIQDSNVKAIYFKRVAFLLATQYANEKQEFLNLENVQKLLDEEIKLGDLFYQQIKKDELDWIKQGKDVDAEFSKKYYDTNLLPQRIQDGVGRGKVDMEYLKTDVAAFKLDYRPVPKYEVNDLDSTRKYLLDSLFERKLILEVKEDSIFREKTDVKNGKGLIFNWIWGVVLVCILGLLIWKLK